ncbi:DUF4232 domain-containing protein [Streptomyces sp. NPDC048751]|uniref:DUF4232 domain-containing protein n=1 Tax=Streptomyces sp. NPDC048751 TaxID=3365591 RepID=UPI003717468C
MRTRRVSLLAATGAALAAIALTACGNGTGTKDEGAAQPTAPVTATTSGGATDTQGDTLGGTQGGTQVSDTRTPAAKTPASKDSSGTSRTSDPYAPENRVMCNGSNTRVTAQPVPRPLNHMLITVKNTGSKVCDLTYFPVLRFDEMQWVPQPIEESHPQAVTTLAPGESGYAGALLSAADGSGDGGTTAKKLTVAFQGRTPNSSGGASATPALPAKGVYYDSSLAVTYWLRDMDEALSY